MGTIVKRNQPCLDERKCGSGDARQVYEKGDSHCFSCGKTFPPEEGFVGSSNKDTEGDMSEDFESVDTVEEGAVDEARLIEIKSFQSRGFKERNITKAIAEAYGVKVSYNDEGGIESHYYPYTDDSGDVLGYKVRKLPKKFSYIGKMGGLFGRAIFSGGGKRIIITEGELDAMSIAQAYMDKHQKIYPVISVPSATGLKPLIANREWLRSFDEIVLGFDNDEAGKEATKKALEILGVDKCKIINWGNYKDASEFFCAEGKEVLVRIYDAEIHRPSGIASRTDMRAQMHAKHSTPAIPYPDCLSEFNEKTEGMRKGEIALHISGTGSGKSTVIREIILHLKDTIPKEEKIGVISLEETPGDTSRNLSCMQIKKNRKKQDITPEELDKGFDDVFGTDAEDERVIVLDHQGSIKDESIIDQLMYMILMGCTYIFIDHITILVSEGAEGLSGNEAIDKIMNDLLRIVKQKNVHIGLVSHLRKSGNGTVSFEDGRLASMDDIKGSGSIKQVSLDIYAYARNMNAPTLVERNTIKKAVLKCRETGETGPCLPSYYDDWTGRLGNSTSVPMDEEFEKI